MHHTQFRLSSVSQLNWRILANLAKVVVDRGLEKQDFPAKISLKIIIMVQMTANQVQMTANQVQMTANQVQIRCKIRWCSTRVLPRIYRVLPSNHRVLPRNYRILPNIFSWPSLYRVFGCLFPNTDAVHTSYPVFHAQELIWSYLPSEGYLLLIFMSWRVLCKPNSEW
jgi:hypothetical protein